MDGEADLDVVLVQDLHDLAHALLRLRDGQAVAGHDDDVLGVRHELHHLVYGPLLVLACDFGGLALRQVGLAAEDHVLQRAVHCSAHDVG